MNCFRNSAKENGQLWGVSTHHCCENICSCWFIKISRSHKTTASITAICIFPFIHTTNFHLKQASKLYRVSTEPSSCEKNVQKNNNKKQLDENPTVDSQYTYSAKYTTHDYLFCHTDRRIERTQKQTNRNMVIKYRFYLNGRKGNLCLCYLSPN